MESDDARPTIVRKIDDRTFTIFSGKIPTCVEAAKEILNHIRESSKSLNQDGAPLPLPAY